MKFQIAIFSIIFSCSCFGWAYRSETIAPSPLSGRIGHTAISTGARLIIWGGSNSKSGAPMSPLNLLNDGAIYDLKSKQWKAISLLDAPSPRTGHFAAWMSGKMYIFGGCDIWNRGPKCEKFAQTGGIYDPQSDSWQKMDNAPVELAGYSGQLDDSHFLFYSYFSSIPSVVFDARANKWNIVSIPRNKVFSNDYPKTVIGSGHMFSYENGWKENPRPMKAATYDISTSSWKSIPEFGQLNTCVDSRAIWSETKLVFLSGDCLRSTGETGTSIWDDTEQKWFDGRPFPLIYLDFFLISSSTDKAYVYGGFTKDQNAIYDLYVYDFKTDQWQIATTNEVARKNNLVPNRSTMTAVGNDIVVWGGVQASFFPSFSNEGIVVYAE